MSTRVLQVKDLLSRKDLRNGSVITTEVCNPTEIVLLKRGKIRQIRRLGTDLMIDIQGVEYRYLNAPDGDDSWQPADAEETLEVNIEQPLITLDCDRDSILVEGFVEQEFDYVEIVPNRRAEL